MKNFFKRSPSPTKTKQYIPPTGFGLSFMGLCLVLLAVGFIYESNLVYLYTFLLTGFGVASIILSHFNLKPLSLQKLQTRPLFAGDPLEIEFFLTNSSRDVRYQIEVSHKKNVWRYSHLSALEKKPVLISLTEEVPKKRGYHPWPNLSLQSSFPFRLLRNVKPYKSNDTFLVFPERKNILDNIPPAPTLHSDSTEAPASQKSDLGNEDFQGHKPWTPSDSFRRIDWKVKARTGDLWMQTFENSTGTTQEFFWEQTSAIPHFEDRISQLSYWIQQAVDTHKSFQMHLSFMHWSSGWGEGYAHAEKCWKALALCSEEPNTETDKEASV